MRFSDLNPLMSGTRQLPGYTDTHELVYTCPVCGNRTAITVRINGPPDASKSIWSLKMPDIFDNWNVTIEPSILTHHLKRTPEADIRCLVHITIDSGVVNSR